MLLENKKRAIKRVLLRAVFENRVAEKFLQPYYFLFLYSVGVIPVEFLNTRQKYCTVEKPH